MTVLTTTNIFGLWGLWITYRAGLALYNISPFHPLHRFPGPKLAAASFLYEFWFDFVKGGRYTWEIKRMHEKYGKIPWISLLTSIPAPLDVRCRVLWYLGVVHHCA
jgi:hypothetical protein